MALNSLVGFFTFNVIIFYNTRTLNLKNIVHRVRFTITLQKPES